jgi:hypothetical protein
MMRSQTNSAAELLSGTGVDLHLELTGSGLRAGLIDGLREAVRLGRLAPGTRLPSGMTEFRHQALDRQAAAQDALVVNYSAVSDSAWEGALNALCSVMP